MFLWYVRRKGEGEKGRMRMEKISDWLLENFMYYRVVDQFV